MYNNSIHKIFRSETVGLVERVVPLSAKSFYSASLHKKDTAAIGAIFPASVRCCKLFIQALQTPFSHILVANEDNGSETNVNRNSKIGVRHSIFKYNIMNNEYRLTNDEGRFCSNGFQPIALALQTPFSYILVTNEDDGKGNGLKPIGVLMYLISWFWHLTSRFLYINTLYLKTPRKKIYKLIKYRSICKMPNKRISVLASNISHLK